MKRLHWQGLLMGMVIVVITGFQVYWLKDTYSRERKAVEVRTDALFYETVRQVQDSLWEEKWESFTSGDSGTTKMMGKMVTRPFKGPSPAQPIRVISRIGQKLVTDSISGRRPAKGVFISVEDHATHLRDSSGKLRLVLDSLPPGNIGEIMVVNSSNQRVTTDSPALTNRSGKAKVLRISESVNNDSTGRSVEVNTLFFDNENGNRFQIRLDSLVNDSIPLPILSASFKRTLEQEKLSLPFTVSWQKDVRRPGGDPTRRPLLGSIEGYRLQLGNTFPYLIRQIALPILFSVFLVGLTVFVLVLLYRSLLRQRRLAQLKNELISNITHELKTPIATVGVAIEALKNFNAMQDPERTREYLDISQNELQRLGLLVDKVLKLAMFEKKEIELKYELLNLEDVVNEVIASLRLQIEKQNATVTLESQGNTSLRGDRLHLLSVVFNLLDNALKYNKGNVTIRVLVKEDESNVEMKVTDNGIGIPAMYKEKIFEKFFRVPSGNTHDAKGHGLGLSYAAQVLRQHQGTITLDSVEGIGSTFTLIIPKNRES